MVWLDPWQFLIVFVLDFFIGHPEDWPHLAKFKHNLALYYEKTIARSMGRSTLGGLFFWLIILATILACYWVLAIISGMVHFPLRWWLDTIVLYQCLMVFEVDRQIRSIIRPLAGGHLGWSQEKLFELTSEKAGKYSEEKICQVADDLIHECALTNLLGPLFWAVLFGIPGVLLYK